MSDNGAVDRVTFLRILLCSYLFEYIDHTEPGENHYYSRF